MGGSFWIRCRTAKLWRAKTDARGIDYSEHLKIDKSFLFRRYLNNALARVVQGVFRDHV